MKDKSWDLQTILLITGFVFILLSNDITSFVLIDVIAFSILNMEFDANKVDIFLKGGLFLIGVLFIIVGFRIDNLEDNESDKTK